MCQSGRKIIAKNIFKYRNLRNLKREELSLLIDFDPSYISKLEKGKINATIDTIELIANALKVNISSLFEK